MLVITMRLIWHIRLSLTVVTTILRRVCLLLQIPENLLLFSFTVSNKHDSIFDVHTWHDCEVSILGERGATFTRNGLRVEI